MHLIRLHQNAQRLLRTLAVVNPYADRLTFLSDKTRTRRDHEKYLTLIDTIALLHQHQRPVRTMLDAGQAVEYVEVTAEDVAQANAIAHEVLGRSLDELPPQTRRLLASVVEHVRSQARVQAIPQAEVRFTRKDLRAATGWGDTQLKVHLARLAELEYLLTHRAERGQGFAYELLFDGDVAAGVHLSGLIDTAGLGARDYDVQRSGSKPERSAPGRGVVGLRSGVVHAPPSAAEQALARLADDEADDEPQTHVLRPNGKHPSYVAASLPTSSLAAEVHQ